MSTRLERLKAKQAELEAAVKAAEAEARERQKQNDAKRHVIIGSALAPVLDNGGKDADALRRILDANVKGKRARKALGLPENEEKRPATG